MTRVLCLFIISAIAPGAFAQDLTTLPPPSETQTTRIRIPISKEGTVSIPPSDAEDAELEMAALNFAAQANGWVPEGTSGILRKGMQVQVTVMVQGNTVHSSEPQRINESGSIGLPLIDDNVKIVDKSIDDIEKQLTEEYKVYYRNPLINVTFVGAGGDPSSSPWGYITIMGTVGSNGPLAMPPTGHLTLSGALKKSGGLAASAKDGAIKIFRPIPSEQTVEVIKADLDDLGKKGEHQEDVMLRAGDVIFVPERIF